MKNLIDVEIIQLNTRDGKLVALISYCDSLAPFNDINHGYNTMEVPVNLRDVQLSVRGNMLVDQSKKEESVAACN